MRRYILTYCIILIGFVKVLGQEKNISFSIYPTFRDSSSCRISIYENNAVIDFSLRENNWKSQTDSISDFNKVIEILINYDFYLGFKDKEPSQFIQSQDTTLNIMTGLDGIVVSGKYYSGTKDKEFEIWSPNKEYISHDLIAEFFEVITTNFKCDTVINYMESIEGYFDFGLGLKKISNDPKIFKLYGSLTSSYEKEIVDFFSNLPMDEDVTIDLTNLSGMGTMYYSIVRNLIAGYDKLYWKVDYNTPALYHLRKIGVPDSLIFSDYKISKIKEDDYSKRIKYKKRK
ncbi:hypothetical protein [Labilibacter marinus]|uniref:hypothetical protein n=1 Tax=Labilibacter marinus TaxID=1477105 RepID=UPI000829CD96|nr:hypothetical protein [Labilibacter marinus]